MLCIGIGIFSSGQICQEQYEYVAKEEWVDGKLVGFGKIELRDKMVYLSLK